MQEKKTIHPDKARLSEDSVLFKAEDRRSEREKLKSMTNAQRLEYIWEYYGIKILVGLALLGMVVLVITSAFFSRKIAFQIVAVNAGAGDAPAEAQEFYAGALTSCGIDPGKVTVSITSSLAVSESGEDDVSRTNIQMIQSRFMTNSVDVFLAPEDFFYSLAEFEYLGDLEEYLSEEQLAPYADKIVYVTGVESGRRYAAGIRLEENAWVKATGWYDGPVVVGIADHAKHEAVALELLGEILGTEP